MSLISHFVAQRAAFEAAYDNGDWHSVGAFFHSDIVYEVMNMPFHCAVSGRSAVLAGFARSIDRFDKKCRRTVGIGSAVHEEGANVLVNAGIRFEREGAPVLEARLWEVATYRDGLIERIIDVYAPEANAQFAQWMADWGAGLDPRYVD